MKFTFAVLLASVLALQGRALPAAVKVEVSMSGLQALSLCSFAYFRPAHSSAPA